MMKLSLSQILNEVKIEDVAKRAMSKRFLQRIADKFLFDKNNPQHLEEIPKVASREMSHIINTLLNETDIPNQFHGIALQWYITQFINGLDASSLQAFGIIEKFFQYQRYATEKNLMNIRSLDQLFQISDDAFKKYQERTSGDKIEKLKREAEYEKILETPKYNIFIPHNKAAACFLGLQTKWCTAATDSQNYYADYHKSSDPLFIFFDKQTKEKFQVHFGSDQFMDAQDEEVPMNKKVEFIKTLQPLAEVYESVPEITKNPERKSEYPFLIRGWNGVKYLDINGNVRVSKNYIRDSHNEKLRTIYYNEKGDPHREDGPAITIEPSARAGWNQKYILNGIEVGEVTGNEAIWCILSNDSKKQINIDLTKDALDKTDIRILFNGYPLAELFPHGIEWSQYLSLVDQPVSMWPGIAGFLGFDVKNFIEKIYQFCKKYNIWDLEKNHQNKLMFEFIKEQNKGLVDKSQLEESLFNFFF